VESIVYQLYRQGGPENYNDTTYYFVVYNNFCEPPYVVFYKMGSILLWTKVLAGD